MRERITHRGRSTTLTHLYDDLFDRYDDRTAIDTDETRVTYAELEERTAKVANFLHSIGLESEDRIGILMENRPEYMTTLVGAMRANVTAVPLNSASDSERIKSILRNVSLDVLVIGPKRIDLGRELQHSDIDIAYFIGVGPDRDLPLGFHGFEPTLSKADAATPAVNTQPSDIATIYHTGGTTGEPKATLHDHRGLSLNLYSHFYELDIRRHERILLASPLGHSAGLFAMAALAQGGTVSLERTFDPSTITRRLLDDGITWTYVTPTMISKLLEQTDETVEFESLDTVVYGSAPLSPPKLREGLDRFGDVFIQFYGLTEVPNLVAVLSKSRHDPDAEEWLRSVGRPTRFADLTVFTDENDWDDDVGEIGIRAPYAMVGYHEDRRGYGDERGWIRTGDLGRIDETGRLYVLDRLENVIIVDGQPVYSTEIETVIERHPDVSKAAVIGIPEEPTDVVNLRPEQTEQAVKAIIVPTEGKEPSGTAIREYCRDHLEPRQLPNSVDIVGDLPETPYGKVDRHLLREPYW